VPKDPRADPPPKGQPPGASQAGSRAVLELAPVSPAPAVPDLADLMPQSEPPDSLLARCYKTLQSTELVSFLASFVLHALSALTLMLLMLVRETPTPGVQLTATWEGAEPLDWATEATTADVTIPQPVEHTLAALSTAEPQLPKLAMGETRPSAVPLLQEIGTWVARDKNLEWDMPRDVLTSDSLGGRSPGMRQTLSLARGGTQQSELAVERGLRWLAAHRLDSGGWNFDHRKGICQGQCRNPGSSAGINASTTAATGLALLAFLGAGYTHASGEYQDPIQRALYYLRSRARPGAHPAENCWDLQEGDKGMYGHALATMAVCEAYAMTRDPGLRELAQRSIDFIIYAQDKKGGGWRYAPGDQGDTTVTGWQLMALKSAQMSRLHVPSPSLFLICRFLDHVQSQEGACYGYLGPESPPRHTTTAIGLLCRMYSGWGRDNPAMRQGVEYLAKWGPSKDDMYYNYYATQVLDHFGGPTWDAWNRQLRESLIASQATEGHEAGSWYFGGGYGDVGGRLYNTAMAVMVLEVYYRYLPLYSQRSITVGF